MDDFDRTDSPSMDENLFDELYQMVFHGRTAELKIRLEQLPNAMEYLTTFKWDGGEQLTLLMVAALHGHDEIVRLLLTCDPSAEQIKLRGRILDQNDTIMNGVNALYCACYQGHFGVAKTLIEVGKADVNEVTSDYPYYPLLLHAVINNRLDIVRFLVENRYADVNETKSLSQRQSTALTHAARDGHGPLVDYLLKAGADVSYCYPTENLPTGRALRFAAQENHLEIFMTLYRARGGARIDHSLLKEAVNRKSYSILGFLLNERLITPDQLELEATSSLSWSPQIEVLHNWVELLEISLEYRQRTGQRKVCPPPLSVYDYQQECQTVDELKSIADKHDRIFVEYLLVQDRLLPLDQRQKMLEILEEYSVMLVEKKRFNICLDLCHHHFDLTEQNDGRPSLHLFVWLICEMLSSNQRLCIDRFLQVANLIFRPSYWNDTTRSLNNAVVMVVLATKVTFFHPPVTLSMIRLCFQILQHQETTADNRRAIYTWIQDLCRHNLRMSTGETLLHLCVDEKTSNNLQFRSATLQTHITSVLESTSFCRWKKQRFLLMFCIDFRMKQVFVCF